MRRLIGAAYDFEVACVNLFCCGFEFRRLVKWIEELKVVPLKPLGLCLDLYLGHVHLGLYRPLFRRGLRVVTHVHRDHL